MHSAEANKFVDGDGHYKARHQYQEWRE